MTASGHFIPYLVTCSGHGDGPLTPEARFEPNPDLENTLTLTRGYILRLKRHMDHLIDSVCFRIGLSGTYLNKHLRSLVLLLLLTLDFLKV